MSKVVRYDIYLFEYQIDDYLFHRLTSFVIPQVLGKSSGVRDFGGEAGKGAVGDRQGVLPGKGTLQCSDGRFNRRIVCISCREGTYTTSLHRFHLLVTRAEKGGYRRQQSFG